MLITVTRKFGGEQSEALTSWLRNIGTGKPTINWEVGIPNRCASKKSVSVRTVSGYWGYVITGNVFVQEADDPTDVPPKACRSEPSLAIEAM